MNQYKTERLERILGKLGITELNPMQEAASAAIHSNAEVLLLSPTGSGKTLAYLLPILDQLGPDLHQVQVLILVPSRELAIQIEQVAKDMGSGFKTNAVYGGQAIAKDKKALERDPTILIGTPGRILDHIRRKTVSTEDIRLLILDEYDKSLEVGFEEQMTEIIESLPHLEKKVLTSATEKDEIPSFLKIGNPFVVNFLNQAIPLLDIQIVIAEQKNKLDTLEKLLRHIGPKNGIIFCNYKDSIRYVSEHLMQAGINHATFHGGLEQRERERALIKFRNGTINILLASDLAARGLDVPDMDFIIHYQIPMHEEEFIHRNGRTARMNSDGTAYVIKWDQEALPDFISGIPTETLADRPLPPRSKWTTLFISGGRKDKISKGDIAGLFFKMGNLSKGELGNIELKQDCAFVAVPISKSQKLIQTLNNTRLKKKKVRVKLLD